LLLAEEAGEEKTVQLEGEDVAWPSRWGWWLAGRRIYSSVINFSARGRHGIILVRIYA
jgi:hypothetical protein